jgi:3-phenylpropionate/cinnamic acid dioxygenase small subunit
MRAAIDSLLVRYCDLVDAADWEGVGDLFSRGALLDERGRELARGAEAVAAFYRSSVRLHDGSPRTKHVVLNTVVSAPEPDGTVTASSSYLVLQAVDDLALQPIITGRYFDRFARDETGGMRFAERRFRVDLAGDLSHHLTYEI